MEIGTVIAYLCGLALIYVVARALIIPFRYLGRLASRACIGAAVLWAGNLVGQRIADVTVSVNPLTASIAGLFGIPGGILLLSLAWLVS